MNKLLACAAATLLMLGIQTASADPHDRWDRDRGHSHFDKHDNGRGWAHGRRKHDHYRGRDRDRDHDHVSVSLSFGNVVPDWRYRDYGRATSGLGIAYTTTWGAPYNTWNRRGGDTVIVHQNTYVNNEPRVIQRSTRNTSSLLRDVNGRCFERSFDSRGNETRVELPVSSCNF